MRHRDMPMDPDQPVAVQALRYRTRYETRRQLLCREWRPTCDGREHKLPDSAGHPMNIGQGVSCASGTQVQKPPRSSGRSAAQTHDRPSRATNRCHASSRILGAAPVSSESTARGRASPAPTDTSTTLKSSGGSRQLELAEQALCAKLAIVRAHGLDEVADLITRELELEALALRVLEDVTKLGLGHRAANRQRRERAARRVSIRARKSDSPQPGCKARRVAQNQAGVARRRGAAW